MDHQSRNYTQTFNLLTIGQRGVGKTVFLAGSYSELNQVPTKHSQPLRFDCEDNTERAKFEQIYSYVARTGQYPPPTLKITSFNFSLKRRHLWGEKTLYSFRWWDIPGEFCHLDNADFQKLVLSSHAGCIFINTDALLNAPAYLQSLEETIRQVVTIATVAQQHDLKYPLALIFTKCDLLDGTAHNLLKIESKVQPLLARLESIQADYKKFYSAIPIVSHAGQATLKAKGAAQVLLWLGAQLRKLSRVKPQQNLNSQLIQDFNSSLSQTNDIEDFFVLSSTTNTGNNILTRLSIVGIGLVGFGIFLFFTFRPFLPTNQLSQIQNQRLISQYEQRLQLQPNDDSTIINLARLYILHGQPQRAIPLIEKLGRECQNGYPREKAKNS